MRHLIIASLGAGNILFRGNWMAWILATSVQTTLNTGTPGALHTDLFLRLFRKHVYWSTLAVRRFAESIRDEFSGGTQLQAVLNELVEAIDGLKTRPTKPRTGWSELLTIPDIQRVELIALRLLHRKWMRYTNSC